MTKQCKQLECELQCKATASLDQSLAADFAQKDKDIKNLLEDKDESEDKPEPIN